MNHCDGVVPGRTLSTILTAMSRMLLLLFLPFLFACRTMPAPPSETPVLLPLPTVEGPSETPAGTISPAGDVTVEVFVPVAPGEQSQPPATSPTSLPPVASEKPTDEPAHDPPPAAPVGTPYVSFIPDFTPRPELGPSKMGIHVARPNSPAILEFVRAAHPAVVKGVDDLGFLAEVKAASPERRNACHASSCHSFVVAASGMVSNESMPTSDGSAAASMGMPFRAHAFESARSSATSSSVAPNV